MANFDITVEKRASKDSYDNRLNINLRLTNAPTAEDFAKAMAAIDTLEFVYTRYITGQLPPIIKDAK